jgi:uncharacterized membrane protein
VNKLFAFILFAIGIALMLTAACANPIIGYLTPGVSLLDTWGIIWRIGLGLVLIVIAVLLNNLEGLADRGGDY